MSWAASDSSADAQVVRAALVGTITEASSMTAGRGCGGGGGIASPIRGSARANRRAAGFSRDDRGLAPRRRRAGGRLEQLGLSVATCTPEYRFARHLRRSVLTTDLAEAAAMRHALTRALRRHRPRAIVYSSPRPAMLQPRSRLDGATAVRFDAPAAVNRQRLRRRPAARARAPRRCGGAAAAAGDRRAAR